MLNERFDKALEHTAFDALKDSVREFIKDKSLSHRLTFSQIRQFITACVDLQAWEEDIKILWDDKNDSFKEFLKTYESLKNTPKRYDKTHSFQDKREVRFQNIDKEFIGFGKCPVASEKTRCCNLLTLDVYEGCGFGCSYCSIQTFYGQEIRGIKNLSEKLSKIKLDSSKIYHIGTGQSSDSLIFGNKNGSLQALIEFAWQNQNVILEFKSKSDNIAYLLKTKLPPNLICTFSLNPQIVIQNEERFTASLQDRLKAAKALNDKGVLVGFHFHPMILFDGWEDKYQKIALDITSSFLPDRVALISMGTLTFTKPVLKQIRVQALKTKILRMPLVESGGKYSYPLDVKELMFKTLYQAFKDWHDKVFFYLCMEDKSLWQKTLGYEYNGNDAFEEAMKKTYMQKISSTK